jgi:hypothetical protein
LKGARIDDRSCSFLALADEEYMPCRDEGIRSVKWNR